MTIVAAMFAMTINFCWDGSCGTYVATDAREHGRRRVKGGR